VHQEALAAAAAKMAGTQADLVATRAELEQLQQDYQGQWQLVQDLHAQRQDLAERNAAALRQVRNFAHEITGRDENATVQDFLPCGVISSARLVAVTILLLENNKHG
jgi:septal ring factor EnvC (AmiA/AmiB activator)